MKRRQRMHEYHKTDQNPEKKGAIREQGVQSEQRYYKRDFQMCQSRHIQPDPSHKRGLLMTSPCGEQNKQAEIVRERLHNEIKRNNDQDLRQNIQDSDHRF